jgi:hypothetical protein
MYQELRSHIISLLNAGIRLDGRTLTEYRKPIEVEQGVVKTAEGSARVKIGETDVMVGVKLEVGKPYPDTPDEGTIIVGAELLPLSNPEFELGQYHKAVGDELEGFGFKVQITPKEKKINTAVQSAFIKADSPQYDMAGTSGSSPADRAVVYKIKFEIDTRPPGNFGTEVRYLLQPIEFFVKTMAKEDLFAGKMHAVLCRGWKNRVKGRDWFDMVWYCKNEIPLHLGHLEARLKQSGLMRESETLTREKFRTMLLDRIEEVDIDSARRDVRPFIQDPQRLDVWSKPFFMAVLEKIKY